MEKVKRRIGIFFLSFLFFLFGGDCESYFGKCTKKGVLVFGLSLWFFFGGTSEKVVSGLCIAIIVFTAVLGRKICM